MLYLGRFIPAKHPETILELARRAGPDVDFLLAGEGPLWEDIRRQAAAIGPHVKVREFLTEPLAPLMHRAQLAAFPSTYLEGLPRFLLEAGAAAAAAAAYDVRGSQDVIDPDRQALPRAGAGGAAPGQIRRPPAARRAIERRFFLDTDPPAGENVPDRFARTSSAPGA